MRLTLSVLFFLTGCPTTDDSGAKTDSTGTTDTNTQPTGDCLDENEECGPGTCEGDGENMLPGADCLACHAQGSGEREAEPWSAAGTVFSDILGTGGVRGATVRITDATGTTVTLQTSQAGNFYTDDPLTPPLRAEVETDGVVRTMSQEVTTGACNSCHQCDGAAHGKIYK